MGLESMHARSLMERPHHPDEPQLVRWTGRRAEPWTELTEALDEIWADIQFRGRHRRPWGRRTKPWTLATAATDNNARDPEWSAAA